LWHIPIFVIFNKFQEQVGILEYVKECDLLENVQLQPFKDKCSTPLITKFQWNEIIKELRDHSISHWPFFFIGPFSSMSLKNPRENESLFYNKASSKDKQLILEQNLEWNAITHPSYLCYVTHSQNFKLL